MSPHTYKSPRCLSERGFVRQRSSLSPSGRTTGTTKWEVSHPRYVRRHHQSVACLYHNGIRMWLPHDITAPFRPLANIFSLCRP